MSEVDREAVEDPPAGEQLVQSTMTLDKTERDTMATSHMGPTGKQIKAKVPRLGLNKESKVVRKSRNRKPAAEERKKNLERMRNWAATGRMTGSLLDLRGSQGILRKNL